MLRSGNPGNRGGGRTSHDKLKWLEKLVTGPRMRRRLRKLLRTGANTEVLALFKEGTARRFGAPNQRVELKKGLADLLSEDETAV